MKISTGLPLFNTPVDPQGTENQSANAIFHAGSASLTSHVIDVTETPIIVKAYGFLNDASTITVWTVTTQRGNVVTTSPMILNGHTVQLSNRNNTLVIDLTGKYKFVLSDGLGVTTCVYHESGLPLWSFGLAQYAIANGMLQFVETETVKPVVSENQIKLYVKLSQDGAGSNLANLLQVHHTSAIPDDPIPNPPNVGTDVFDTGGLYFGVDPGKYRTQYVSSSVGDNINNTGLSAASPVKSIQFAISRLPDGTRGIIYLLAGDTFCTYVTDPMGAAIAPVGDVAGSFPIIDLGNIVAVQGLAINNRVISFYPYNDPVITAVSTYNNAHGTVINPYVWKESNFPTIKFVYLQASNATNYFFPATIQIGSAGGMSLSAVSIEVGQTGTVNPNYPCGCMPAIGNLAMSGGHLTIGNVPLFGNANGVGNQVFGENNLYIHDHDIPGLPGGPTTAVSTPPVFNISGTNLVINSSGAYARGITPPGTPVELPYTSNGDNTEAFLKPKALWPGIYIYSRVARAYRRVQTDIVIGTADDPFVP
jgi:hypothetical protein